MLFFVLAVDVILSVLVLLLSSDQILLWLSIFLLSLVVCVAFVHLTIILILIPMGNSLLFAILPLGESAQVISLCLRWTHRQSLLITLCSIYITNLAHQPLYHQPFSINQRRIDVLAVVIYLSLLKYLSLFYGFFILQLWYAILKYLYSIHSYHSDNLFVLLSAHENHLLVLPFYFPFEVDHDFIASIAICFVLYPASHHYLYPTTWNDGRYFNLYQLIIEIYHHYL